jgi:uncharacterized SAM-binding protein YcdF (DUF218 family)
MIRISLLCAAIPVALLIWAVIARETAPQGNTDRRTFDAIIVLGTAADNDGNPTPELLDRVSEAVREYQRGVAPHLIFSGAAAHNQFVEADVMVRAAESQGIPASVILKEPQALDTIQNACYSAQILKSHGLSSAEVISSPYHLPRAGLIFSRVPLAGFNWHSHPAPGLLTPGYISNTAPLVEILKTARYLAWAQWREPCDL